MMYGFKKSITILCGLTLLVSASLCIAEQSVPVSEKASIAVMSYTDFVPDRTGVDQSQRIGLPDVLAGRIIEKLSNNQRFTVVERKALRRTVLEQRFDQKMATSHLDKALDKALETMKDNSGSEVDATSDWSNYNDVLKDFSDLGSTVGADFIVLGELEQIKASVKLQAVPYSRSGKVMQNNQVDARLRLRIINAKNGTVAGAASIKTKLSETIFQGMKSSDSDEFTFYDHLATVAAAKILDITFPARIVSVEPLIISRGSNDGVKKGDRYIIQREGKEIRNKSGMLLARLKEDVGEVEVVSTQKTISIVTPLANQKFQLNDLAVSKNTETQPDMTRKKTSIAGSIKADKNIKKGPATLAMGLIHKNQAARTFAGFNQGYLERISDEIISGLTNSKRFIMLERDQVDQVLDEKIFETMASGGNIQDRLSELVGADYLIHGEINNFYIATETKKVPYVDEIQTFNFLRAEGVFRIVDVHTGAIISSEKIVINEKVKGVVDRTQLISQMVEKFSTRAIARIVARLYPIKVMGTASDGTVYLNRGVDSGLKIGEQFVVKRPGQALIDPDTGQSFGQVESKIATIEIIEVEGSRSRAKITSGSAPVSGDILRKSQTPVKKPKPKITQPAW